ncbi:MAG TPA: UDP-N-acetylglucosamine 1-carboxyvinyltransferase, partial [Phycisphaerae bacterium]|nr:UDP-N-acetylglucosamine 1-carboxyvinyltransferase [Phycisphaerae bacterium]
MDQFHIEGGRRLRGEVMIGGAKNAALPIMAASLLTDQPCRIDSVPDLADVAHLTVLLEELGVRVQREQGALSLQTADESNSHARYDLVRKMRASVCVLGPLLAKRRSARVAMPGGCAIGPRPIDIHLRGLRALGAEIHLAEGDIVARADGGLKGAEVFLGGPFGSTVTGTANVMMAAVLATGTSVIECAACEPEIQDLAKCLNGMGAKISGAGTPRLVIEGVDSLGGAAHTVIPDRIEAGTFMIASAITNGEIRLSRARLDHMMAVVATLRQVGVIVEKSDGGAVVSSSRHLLPADVTTQP